MKNPLISIILTYYKKRNFIERTIRSLSNQSYKKYQLIIVYDDIDKTDLNFLKKKLSKIKNKKIIVNKKNFGVAESRNIGLKNVKGAFTAFLDADDVWHRDKLKNQIKIMLNKKADLTYSSYKVIDEKDRKISEREVSKHITYDRLIKSCEIGLSTVMVRSNILKKFKFPPIKTQEDFGLWLKLLRKGYKFIPIKRVYSSWRMNYNSLSSNKLQKIFDAFTLMYVYENKNLIYSFYSVVVLSINKIFKK